jgi:hypothetical protein
MRVSGTGRRRNRKGKESADGWGRRKELEVPENRVQMDGELSARSVERRGQAVSIGVDLGADQTADEAHRALSASFCLDSQRAEVRFYGWKVRNCKRIRNIETSEGSSEQGRRKVAVG